MNVTGIALTFGGTGNRIEQNTVSASKGAAIRLAETGSSNQVLRNLVTLSGEEGIRVIDSAALRVEGNSVYDNRGDGIFVDEQDTDGTAIRRNTTNHNGDDGIDADSGLLTIESNIAEHNADLGIEAVAGRHRRRRQQGRDERQRRAVRRRGVLLMGWRRSQPAPTLSPRR